MALGKRIIHHDSQKRIMDGMHQLRDSAMTYIAAAAQRALARSKKKKRLAKAKRLGLNGARSLKGRRKKADALFAAYIRERDGNRCQVCHSTEYPQCSHFIGRGTFATRFNKDNCDCLCAKCHFDFEHKKHEGGAYGVWKKAQLGERFEGLIALGNQKVRLQDAVTEFFGWFDQVKT